jgi:ribosomal-protein-alanine N-acetyltransferase
MPGLERLQAGHEPALLVFELENRSYFTASVSDRGDEYFERFADHHRGALADQQAGRCALYLLVAGDGSVLGRFNLYDIGETTATVGYRVARHVAGRGVATRSVLELCRIATTDHGLRRLRAATSAGNLASQRVLTKAGFLPVGPADPGGLGGRAGTWYERDLDQRPGGRGPTSSPN